MVATAVVLADTSAASPLLGLFTGRGAAVFAAVAALAVANGVLVQIITLARLFYGMARQGQLPAILARVHRRTQTPVRATLLAGAIVFVTALFVPFEQLLILTNAATLAVFVLVDLALWRVQRTQSGPVASMSVPRWIPPLAAALSLALIAVELLS